MSFQRYFRKRIWEAAFVNQDTSDAAKLILGLCCPVNFSIDKDPMKMDIFFSILLDVQSLSLLKYKECTRLVKWAASFFHYWTKEGFYPFKTRVTYHIHWFESSIKNPREGETLSKTHIEKCRMIIGILKKSAGNVNV